MKTTYTAFLLFAALSLSAQVTLRVTSIPSNTPVGATIYAAGSFNTWSPGDANFTLQPDGLGAFVITIPEGTGTAEFKFTRGSWPTVEGNAAGSFLPNRTFTFTGSPQTLNLTILSWEDLGGTGGNNTAAPNVQILNPSFFMPQLNRSRRIWLYLPPDYQTTNKHYPVLYIQDGQNLFNNATAFNNTEWQVDETLNTLHANGDFGAIVVGIDNGGTHRINEYTPWVNAQYGGGESDAYMTFVAETLKPYIDENFRTRPEPQFNALFGSSLGALISTYGACEYPGTFRKVGAFSPAYWININQLNNYINTTVTGLENHRMYFVASLNESATMASHLATVRDNLINAGLPVAETFTKLDNYGGHNELYWRGEFGAAYQWLFQNETLSSTLPELPSLEFIQTSTGKIWVNGLHQPEIVILYNVQGQQVGMLHLSNGYHELPHSLARGMYFIKSNLFHKKVFKH